VVDVMLEALAEIARIAHEELEFEGDVLPSHDLLRDLHLDSLGLTVLAVGLENRFRVMLSEEDAQGVRTVEDLARLVAAKARAPHAGAEAHP
jgi:acyl carrier protein